MSDAETPNGVPKSVKYIARKANPFIVRQRVSPITGQVFPPPKPPPSIEAQLSKPQAQDCADAVAERIRRLEAHAARIGAGLGIPSTPLHLSVKQAEPATSKQKSGSAPGETPPPQHYIVLEKHDGRWALFFHREQSALRPGDGNANIVALHDAPLDVRMRFLQESEAFFRDYLATCQERIQLMKSAIAAADRTLAMLEDVKPD